MGQVLSMQDIIRERLDVLSTQPFRARFHLRAADQLTIRHYGMDVVMQHASDFIKHRIAPAQPRKDGHQTPFRGHPVFLAQHATATCCRGCLEQWHHIPKGHNLGEGEQHYISDVIALWLHRETSAVLV